jgi:hypothetical protein
LVHRERGSATDFHEYSAGEDAMIEIEEKIAGIRDMVSREELARLETRMADSQRIVCPLNKRYWQMPLACVGYRYVCPHLDRMGIACNHPEKREWKVSYAGPDVKILTR